MSEETDKKLSFEEYFRDVPTLKSEWDGRQVDWLLQWICGFVNETNCSVGITLTVGGNVFTGSLISHKTYFERLAKDISRPFAEKDPEAEKAMHERMLGFHTETTTDEPKLPVQYIHLDNTRIHTGGDRILPGSGTLWRGKLCSVDGFVLGEYSQR